MKLDVTHISTERLYIRKLIMADAEEILQIFSDPDVTKYWSSPAMTGIKDAERFIRETQDGFKDRRLLEWGLIMKEQGALIGTCAYSGWEKLHKRAEIGFALNRAFWGKGYMRECLSVFIPFGFSSLGLHRIEADVDPRNNASIKLLELFGFKKEGYLRERYHLNGEVHDAVIYGLLFKDFKMG